MPRRKRGAPDLPRGGFSAPVLSAWLSTSFGCDGLGEIAITRVWWASSGVWILSFLRLACIGIYLRTGTSRHSPHHPQLKTHVSLQLCWFRFSGISTILLVLWSRPLGAHLFLFCHLNLAPIYRLSLDWVFCASSTSRGCSAWARSCIPCGLGFEWRPSLASRSSTRSWWCVFG
jgi:hypothetical protein